MSSKLGVGACLLQKGQPISFYSRSLTEGQIKWAPIEKELFAICVAVEKYHQFIYGRKIEIETDHKPLITIIKKDINKISWRLQRMVVKLMKYNVDVKYVPGSKLYIADYLSRHFITENSADDPSFQEIVHSVETQLPIAAKKVQEIQNATKNDIVSSTVIDWYMNGWPKSNKNITDLELQIMYKLKNDIHVQNDVIYKNDKIVIPKPLRSDILNNIHTGHLGINKCKKRARSVVYWPGMSKDIDVKIGNCKVCQQYQPANVKEPMLSHDIPNLPFLKIAADILHYNEQEYLVIEDYLSKWIEIKHLKNKTAADVILKLKEIFSTHGIPKIIVADNMPFSSVEFQKFAHLWTIELVASSPRYPKSNSLAERAVGMVKSILKKCEEDKSDIYLGLLNYRNSPICGINYTPAQILMSRNLRSIIPSTAEFLKPIVITDARELLIEKQNKYEQITIKRQNNGKNLKRGRRC